MAEKQDNAIWTEKYRPQDFSEIKGQKEIVKRVKAFVDQKNMPHQLYAGPAGVGKSTTSSVVISYISILISDFLLTMALNSIHEKITL